jgi:hypothetical protein
MTAADIIDAATITALFDESQTLPTARRVRVTVATESVEVDLAKGASLRLAVAKCAAARRYLVQMGEWAVDA